MGMGIVRGDPCISVSMGLHSFPFREFSSNRSSGFGADGVCMFSAYR